MIAYRCICHVRKHHHNRQDHRKAQCIIEFSLEFRSFEPKYHKQDHNERYASDHQHRLCIRKVVTFHHEQVADHLNIGKTKRRNPLCKNTSVDRSEEYPECTDDRTEHRPPAHDIYPVSYTHLAMSQAVYNHGYPSVPCW